LAAVAFVLIAALETWRQRGGLPHRADRWVTNLSLFALERILTLAFAGIFSSVATALAGRSPAAAWTDAWPTWLVLAAAVIVLDAATYLSHVVSHHVEPLWRLHAVHHADDVLDVTTTLRHHPLEILPTTIALGLCAWLFGLTMAHITAYAAIAFVVQSVAHAQLRLPPQTMRYASMVFVTPELHERHHSRQLQETNSNYGQVLSIWDRMFGTLSDGPRNEPLAVGLDTYASARFRGILGTLTLPFRRPDRITSAAVAAPGNLPARN
jgi:sterol desaturase/sphingolipid hydroxylase (fatty acid hydroxylase superfamily)